VGWIKNAQVGRLNRSADRDLPQLQKVIKPEHDTLMPGVRQIGFDPFFQGPEPMTLAGALNASYPSICGCFAGDARSDRLNRSLKALKIPFGSQPDYTTTIRTAIKLKQQWPIVSIKNSFGKTMTPYSVTVTAWTAVRFLPWIISLFFKKFLEFDSRKDYHFTVPCGLNRPTFSQGRQLASFFPPPLLIKIKKASKLRPIYPDKPFLFFNRL